MAVKEGECAAKMQEDCAVLAKGEGEQHEIANTANSIEECCANEHCAQQAPTVKSSTGLSITSTFVEKTPRG